MASRSDAYLEGTEVLTDRECRSLLGHGCVGRLGFVAQGRPYVLPVNYAADEAGAVVFRTGASSMLAAAGQQVVFEVDGIDAEHHAGWSVCVFGRAREITEAGDLAADRLRHLGLVSWAPGHREHWLAITPLEITGRRIPVHGDLNGIGGWFPGIPS